MDNLSAGHCVPCEGGQPPLTSARNSAALISKCRNGHSIKRETVISRRFTFKGFQKTISFYQCSSMDC